MADTKVIETGNSIAFTPEGAVGPMKFSMGYTCGTAINSIGFDMTDVRTMEQIGVSALTRDQALALLAFLQKHVHQIG